MTFHIVPATPAELEPWRDAYRNEARCQIIHDSAIRRGLADAYTISRNRQVLGYGALWNKYYPGLLMEFYVAPEKRELALPMAKALISAVRATRLEAQTNMPGMHDLLLELGEEVQEEYVLFEDAGETSLAVTGATFRPRNRADEGEILEHYREPVGDWVIEFQGRIVATGGYFCHDNSPYGDVCMEVHQDWRRKGIGSFLVQELNRVARHAGKSPAARCATDNIASRNTLERAGFKACGKMLAAKIRRAIAS